MVEQRQLRGWLATNLLQMKTNAKKKMYTYIFLHIFVCNQNHSEIEALHSRLYHIVLEKFRENYCSLDVIVLNCESVRCKSMKV